MLLSLSLGHYVYVHFVLLSSVFSKHEAESPFVWRTLVWRTQVTAKIPTWSVKHQPTHPPRVRISVRLALRLALRLAP